MGATSATPCEPGTFQDQQGQTSCQLAPVGFYVDQTGATSATACPPGTTTDGTGATSLADCVAPTVVPQLAAGNNHTCALRADGVVRCWGDNSTGQLGTGDTTSSLTPVTVTGLPADIVSIAAGDNQTCALTSGGGVKCWGNNADGQVGDGTTIQRNAPVDVVGLGSGVTTIGAGDNHTCAGLAAGGIKCWGWASSGQLGNGTLIGRLRRAARRPRAARRRSRCRDLRRLPSHLCHARRQLHRAAGAAAREGQIGNGGQRRPQPLCGPADRAGRSAPPPWSAAARTPASCRSPASSASDLNNGGQLGNGTDDEQQPAGDGHGSDRASAASLRAAPTPAR